MPTRQLLDPLRTIELGPFGAQRRHRVALAADLAMQLGAALGLQRGIEFDLVDVGCRQHERGEDADVEKSHHLRRSTISSGAGNRGSKSMRSACGAAPVRSAARSLAERARGLAASSAASGVTG